MTNIEMTVDGDKLTVVIDLTQRGKPSTSGKSTIIASTGGNKEVDGHPGLFLGHNLFKK